MGLNVIVQTLDGERHPDWDDAKHSGDRELFEIAKAVPRTDHHDDFLPGGACDWYWRPTDFTAFRAAPWPEVNPERWAHLAEILERDRDYWIFMSV